MLLPAPMTTEAMNQSLLPSEVWIKSLSYLDTNDLHSASLVNLSFLIWSSDDSIWYEICRRRWDGKFNVHRFYVNDFQEERGHPLNSDSSAQEELVAENLFLRTDMTYCFQLIQQFGSAGAVPPLNMGSIIHQPTSWKEAYFMAEIDSRRETISREELVLFRFQLLYNGNPSRMGLRQFNIDGYYDSPYMGRSEWILHGHHLLFAGMSLLVERDKKTWGWVIGRGERTEYRTVEEIILSRD